MPCEPIRSCVGCRARRGTSALVRVTRASGAIAVDGPSSGRGAWLCRTPSGVSESCVESAIEQRVFARAWRGPVSAAEHEIIRERTRASGVRSPDAR